MAKNRVKQTTEILKVLRDLNPNPTTELKYTTSVELLIAVVLSAQATDVGVNKATTRLFPIANTPEAIAALGVEGLMPYISTINFYPTKARNIIGLCEMLITEYNSQVPENFDDLVKLPGVGRKTANVILNTLFEHDTIAVDTHIFRVSNRLGIACGKTPLEVEQNLQKVIPSEFKKGVHHWLILHGRYICKARKPLCEICPIKVHCDYYNDLVKDEIIYCKLILGEINADITYNDKGR